MMALKNEHKVRIYTPQILDGVTYIHGQEFQPTPGDGEGPGNRVGCSPWGHRESDRTDRLKDRQ